MLGIRVRKGTEDEAQMKMLTTPLGLPRSGYERYAAAMYFYKRGEISADLLEVYRKCCKSDAEDPLELARYEKLVD
ncbi:MAG: hypothetical protein WBN04_02230 [Paracoccaceae bacterium]